MNLRISINFLIAALLNIIHVVNSSPDNVKTIKIENSVAGKNETFKRDLKQLSYSYSATDVDLKTGTRIKTITVLKNLGIDNSKNGTHSSAKLRINPELHKNEDWGSEFRDNYDSYGKIPEILNISSLINNNNNDQENMRKMSPEQMSIASMKPENGDTMEESLNEPEKMLMLKMPSIGKSKTMQKEQLIPSMNDSGEKDFSDDVEIIKRSSTIAPQVITMNGSSSKIIKNFPEPISEESSKRRERYSVFIPNAANFPTQQPIVYHYNHRPEDCRSSYLPQSSLQFSPTIFPPVNGGEDLTNKPKIISIPSTSRVASNSFQQANSINSNNNNYLGTVNSNISPTGQPINLPVGSTSTVRTIIIGSSSTSQAPYIAPNLRKNKILQKSQQSNVKIPSPTTVKPFPSSYTVGPNRPNAVNIVTGTISPKIRFRGLRYK